MVLAHRGCLNMNITDLTWDDIVRLLFEQGLWGIAVGGVLVGLILGISCVCVYYEKFRNVKIENDLASAEKELEQARSERKEYKEKYEALLKESRSVEDIIYARGAINNGTGAKPDILASLREVSVSDQNQTSEQ